MRSCFFIGHREATETLLPKIKAATEMLVRNYNVTEFYVGGYGCFDRLAGRAVVEFKKEHPGLHLYRVIPYHPAERKIELPAGFDGTFYPDEMEAVPRRFAIPRANRMMIESSDYLIAYVRHSAASNSFALLELARRREKVGLITVINIAE